MNITDVGHLASDADEGEDKMLLAAKREGKKSEDLASYYTDIFFRDSKALAITRPNIVCKATEHVSQMIQLIERLEQKGFAYKSGGNVYFDVSRFERYGDLAKLDLENLQAGARIDVDSEKRNPFDFALWFTKSKFENQELQWDSPWGRGYPGWHIECSAMAIEYLGETFDIHCGGIDHIPVHHTNEIAQSECATGRTFANVWMHGGFLVLVGDKMSKSSGSFLTVSSIVEKGYDPIAYRLLCLGGTYRNELRWSWEALDAAQNSLRNIKEAVFKLKDISPAVQDNLDRIGLSERASALVNAFEDAIYNDLRMPAALAVLHETLQDTSLKESEKLHLLYSFDDVLGLGIASWEREKLDIPESVVDLARQRDQARSDRDWAKADAIRDQILQAGYIVADGASGFELKKADNQKG
jgi:cysteinyl-tRNA synthetase